MGGSRSYRLRDRRRSTLLRGLFDPRHRRGDRRCRSESIADDLKSAYEWVGHAHTVFEIVGDRLYYADYSTLGTGGAIVAVDLTTGNVVWREKLEALGPIEHSKYLNRMNLAAD